MPVIDLDEPDILDLDEPEAPKRGLIGRAWDFATTPLTTHYDRFAGMPEGTSGRIARVQLGMGGADKLSGGGISSMAASTSPLDIASAPAGAVGKLGQAGRLFEVAQAAGIGTEGLIQLREAYNTGDWSKVPGGVVRLVMGRMGLKGGAAVTDDAAKVLAIEEEGLSAFERASRAKMRAGGDFAPGATAPEVLPPPPKLSFEEKLRAQGQEAISSEALTSPTARTPQTRPYETQLREAAGSAPQGDSALPNQNAGTVRPRTYEEKLRAASASTPPAPEAPLKPAVPDVQTAGDDLARAAQEAEQAVTQMSPETAARVGALPPAPEGTTRLYRNEGTLSQKGGNWFTTNAAEAASYNDGGGTLKYVDVPTARLQQEQDRLGRAGPPEGEFDFSGGMEGYAARAQEVPMGAAGKPVGGLEGDLAQSVELTKGIDGILSQSTTPRLRGGEAGSYDPMLPFTVAAKANRSVGDFLRASVAGDIPTAIRNVQSGLRMVGEAMFENPVAAGFEKLMEMRAKAGGRVTDALAHNRAAKLYMETSKAFGKATFEEGAATFADAFSYLTSGKLKLQGNKSFSQRLKLMDAVGDSKLAKKLGDFSSADLAEGNKITRGLMFFNIMGDRFINRTFLRAHVDAAQKVFGASSPAQLEAMAARNPVLKEQLGEFLSFAGSEAFRASWQNTAASGMTKNLIKALDNTPLGIVVQPFGKAFFANMLPNIMEKIPGVAFASKRVRNSFEFQANRNLIKTLQGAPKTPAIQAQISRLKNENGKLVAEGVYAPAKIYARMTTGAAITTAAIATRLQRGDDGTEFDQSAVELGPDGKATKVASWTSALGEDLPFAYLGDRIAHGIIAQREGRPSKYEGKDGIASLKPLMKSVYGSRYGISNPALDMIGSALSGKQDFDTQFLDRTTRAIAEDLGRMAGAGSWLGGTARRVAAGTDTTGEEAKNRRADVQEPGPLAGRVKEAFLEGAQSQVPGKVLGMSHPVPDRTQLPPSQAWSKLAEGRTVDQLEPLTGATNLEDATKLQEAGKPVSALLSLLPGASRFEVSRLDRFANEHQGKVSLSQILPRRTEEPAFDALVMKHLKEGLQKRALPALESGKIDRLSPEAQLTWFANLSKIRDQAHDRAVRDFRRVTGELPKGEAEKKAKEKEQRARKRETRRELRSVGY